MEKSAAITKKTFSFAPPPLEEGYNKLKELNSEEKKTLCEDESFLNNFFMQIDGVVKFTEQCEGLQLETKKIEE